MRKKYYIKLDSSRGRKCSRALCEHLCGTPHSINQKDKKMILNFGLNINMKIKVKVEKIYIPVNGQSDEHDITTSPIPSKGGRLRRCITFVKDWNWILVPGIGYIIDKLSNGYLNCLVLTEMIQFIFPFTIGLLVAILWREIRNFPRHR